MIKTLRDSKGRYTHKTNWFMVACGIVLIIVQVAYLFRIMPANASPEPQNATESVDNWVEVSKGHWVRMDDSMAKWKVWQDSVIEAQEAKINDLEGFDASISMYSRLDSCHNMKDGKCLTAGGKDVKEGWTVACPRSVALGTVVNIEGFGERTCDDRTAVWVEQKFGGTYDVFTEDYNQAKQYGRKTLKVRIIK